VLLVGYSMGGSISLNYLSLPIPSEIKGAVVFSVPVVLKSSVEALTKKGNGFYRKRFLQKLKAKMQVKARMFPDLIDVSEIERIQYFEEFDERYTAPLHGFESAEAFYDAGSTLKKLPEITRPVLIVNAINDPFLGEECYPFDVCTDLPNIYLEAPKKGGHVGFAMNQKLQSYMDDRPLQFYNTHISLSV
jgi:predicted alpha/beta-fold hydrolase